jgi:hypothetical protein
MKNSPQRKISFLVVLFGMGCFVPVRGQVTAKPPGTGYPGRLNLSGEMLKNESRGFLPEALLWGAFPYIVVPGQGNSANYYIVDPGSRNGEDGFSGVRNTGYPENRPCRNRLENQVTRNVQSMIPADFYYCQSGFFCKREWELEKATHIPFRFRLGSLDYCNALEGKH